MKESDWKLLRKLKPQALERLCQRVLEEMQQAASEPSQTFHQRYLKVFALLQERDEELAWAFDGHSRSNAWLKLRAIASLRLLTEQELSEFSEETRASLVPLEERANRPPPDRQ